MVLDTQHDTCQTLTMTSTRVRTIRKALGMSQEKFADLIGATPRSIVRWELGQKEPLGGYLVLLDLVERGVLPEK